MKRSGSQVACTPTLDALDWLTSNLNRKGGRIAIAYGALIHIHREKDLINNRTGKWFDDDIDTWVSVESFSLIASMEHDLFRLFGWTMRIFITNNVDGEYAVFAQLFSSCGHNFSRKVGKARASEPAIELYPIVSVPHKGQNIVKDLWSGFEFPESMIFPWQQISFNSTGISHPLLLHLPNMPVGILRCLYGNWELPSNHREKRHTCVDGTGAK